MSQKWNLQDIRPAEPRKKRSSRPRETAEESSTETHTTGPNIPVRDGRKKQSKSILYAIIASLLIIGGILSIGAFMAGADITVYPRHREPTINTLVTAYPEKRDGELTYEVMTLSASGESQVEAAGEEEVQEKAVGTIEIIKTTAGSERLVANTRFKSSAGLIYRITDPIRVPGAVKDDSGNSVPGTVRVEVFADDVGETYNLSAGERFTIPGFKESGLTALYENVYAESRTPIDGGYDGLRFSVQDAELSEARQILQQELRDALLQRMESEQPAGFVLFRDAVAFSYEAAPPVEYPESEDLVTIKETATLQIPIFAEGDLAAYVAAATVPGYEDNPVRIDNYADISFDYESATTSQGRIDGLTGLDFTLSGTPELVWTFDMDKFKDELTGEAKDALRLIITEYPAIEGATGKIRPFWKQTYPSDPNLINVTEVIEG